MSKNLEKIQLSYSTVIEYNNNPNKCLYCSSDILCINRKLNEVKIKKFCNTSCAASFNNAGSRKHGDAPVFCACGNSKTKKSNKCKKCRIEDQSKNYEQKTLLESCNKKAIYTASKFNEIRSKARAKLIKLGVEKKCKFCTTDEFIDILEVAHIKGIREFSEDTKIEEVNNISNLMYICPSHHRMFDKKLIK